MEYISNEGILKNIVHNYKMIEKREGTNIVKIVRCEDYDIAKLMDSVAVSLKKYYNDLFYNPKVQTFIYMDLTEYRVYDPYLIEFLIRNHIMDNGEVDYLHVQHQLAVPKTFALDYDHTFFRAFEKKDKDLLKVSNYESFITEINSFGTTFSGRYEPYFKAEYNHPKVGSYAPSLEQELVDKIIDNTIVTYENEMTPIWENIIVKYFNNGVCTEDEINSIMSIPFQRTYNSIHAFYLIPLLIFCIENAIESALN